MFDGIVESWQAVSVGADLFAKLGGIVQLVLNLLPWAAIIALVVIVLNPGGVGDQWLATLRGWLRTAKDAVDGQSERIDAIDKKVETLVTKIDTLVEAIAKK